MTGLLGELALEHILGIKIIDWSIGKSKDYPTPDISDYKVDIESKFESRGSKTGFYGLDKLKPVHSIDDISKYEKLGGTSYG